MDVTTTRLQDRPDPPPTGRIPTPPATPPPPRSDAREAPPERAAEHRWEPRSTLKFSLTSADVQARFEIHEGTNAVTVTMYERETGEVLREVPSRRVLDTIAALVASGHRVDFHT